MNKHYSQFKGFNSMQKIGYGSFYAETDLRVSLSIRDDEDEFSLYLMREENSISKEIDPEENLWYAIKQKEIKDDNTTIPYHITQQNKFSKINKTYGLDSFTKQPITGVDFSSEEFN